MRGAPLVFGDRVFGVKTYGAHAEYACIRESGPVAHMPSSMTFEEAAAAAPEGEKLTAMGHAYMDLLSDERWLRMQLQMYAACADEVIRVRARELYRELVRTARTLSGAPEDELWRFFATGMLINTVSSIGLKEIAAEDEWAALWSDPNSSLHSR